jgi:hypothetical protein
VCLRLKSASYILQWSHFRTRTTDREIMYFLRLAENRDLSRVEMLTFAFIIKRRTICASECLELGCNLASIISPRIQIHLVLNPRDGIMLHIAAPPRMLAIRGCLLIPRGNVFRCCIYSSVCESQIELIWVEARFVTGRRKQRYVI